MYVCIDSTLFEPSGHIVKGGVVLDSIILTGVLPLLMFVPREDKQLITRSATSHLMCPQ